MVHATPKFVKDTSKYWYKPNITREDGKEGTFTLKTFIDSYPIL